MVDEELINLITNMAKKESGYAQELRDLANNVKHPVLKALFLGIASDSRKHAKFYESISALLSNPYPLISQEKLDEIKEAVKKHIITESDMVKISKELAEREKDPRIKLLLMAIHHDELAHHKILVSIQENIAKALTLTEEELWDLIWKDSLWHGTPGG